MRTKSSSLSISKESVRGISGNSVQTAQTGRSTHSPRWSTSKNTSIVFGRKPGSWRKGNGRKTMHNRCRSSGNRELGSGRRTSGGGGSKVRDTVRVHPQGCWGSRLNMHRDIHRRRRIIRGGSRRLLCRLGPSRPRDHRVKDMATLLLLHVGMDLPLCRWEIKGKATFTHDRAQDILLRTIRTTRINIVGCDRIAATWPLFVV